MVCSMYVLWVLIHIAPYCCAMYVEHLLFYIQIREHNLELVTLMIHIKHKEKRFEHPNTNWHLGWGWQMTFSSKAQPRSWDLSRKSKGWFYHLFFSRTKKENWVSFVPGENLVKITGGIWRDFWAEKWQTTTRRVMKKIALQIILRFTNRN